MGSIDGISKQSLRLLLLRWFFRHELKPLSIQTCRTADQRPNSKTNIRTGQDGNRVCLPWTIPIQLSLITLYLMLSESEDTYQSKGMGTAPNHAPTPVPRAPPHTASAGLAMPQTSLQVLVSTPWT